VRIAVVLFNLGGPDSLDAVQPFLRNLFGDPAIIALPAWLRLPLAGLLARRRSAKARGIYGKIGGSSPILGQTEAQARALEDALGHDHQWRAFVCMRYWHPMTAEVVQDVKEFAPDRIVLMPLYPQFSTTTTGSSVAEWQREVARLPVPTRIVCCYAEQEGFIAASVELLRSELRAMREGAPRLLFSAHGLPEKVIRSGDPYQSQVERTARAIVAALGEDAADWTVCYQSRVGPLKWIGPSTEEEIVRAGREKKPVVLYPLAFVSEHSETLVELDMDYRDLAGRSGVPEYRRVPTVGTHRDFVKGLAALVRQASVAANDAVCNDGSVTQCPLPYTRCPRRMAGL